ncbi:MAG: riboflavin biosynthesis protein RibF [Rhodopirellula sp. TMED11]|nr:MAG: riboflavin biosynthesis protein RibF [Rhodopirellula sp. TMED11]
MGPGRKNTDAFGTALITPIKRNGAAAQVSSEPPLPHDGSGALPEELQRPNVIRHGTTRLRLAQNSPPDAAQNVGSSVRFRRARSLLVPFPPCLAIVTQIVHITDVDQRPMTDAGIAVDLRGGVLSIGNFDGVHLGHQHLLKQTRRLADQLSGPAIACLFHPHPIKILRPQSVPVRLTTIERRAELMQPLGIDYLLVCQTTAELLSLTAETFFQRLILQNLKVAGLVEGANFCFGKARAGDTDLLRQLSLQNQLECQIVPLQTSGDQTISSSKIRNWIEAGDIESPIQLADYRHVISGRVVIGDQRGGSIGFPTANLGDIDVLIPPAGVYAGSASIGEKRYAAAIHLGPSPTFQSGQQGKVEVHVIGYSGDLYGSQLQVELRSKLRDVISFADQQALIDQLNQDVSAAKQLWLSEQKPQ